MFRMGTKIATISIPLDMLIGSLVVAALAVVARESMVQVVP
tara:strand:+ start:121 stop:243 length:123 start_codon:yes stop_codon:yes gene_type:complete